MSEKMRGALFGALGDISGLSVLDAFAGSGAVGFEAISRGAERAVLVDVDKKAHTAIKNNIDSLGVEEQVEVVRAYFNAWSTRHQAQAFDIVVADPPYDDLPFRDLKFLFRHVKLDGILVLSWPGKADPYYIPTMKEVLIKPHGDGQLIFYKHK